MSTRAKYGRVLAAALFAWLSSSLLAGPAYCAPDRPLVFVPGILGSRLADQSGKAIWGEVNSLRNFQKFEITPDGPVTVLSPDGLMRTINVLGPFWAVHGYDALLEHLQHDLGYVEDKTLFIFPYDWRQSNFDTASELDRFIKSKRALSEGKFDILAHSMGGIVVKIWALDHGGASRLHEVIYMGTPFQGSMNAFGILSNGWGKLNFIAGGIDTIRRVALSFPSLYELLPTYDHCCRLGTPQSYTDLAVLQASTWRNRNWLPAEYEATGARAHMFEVGLERARQIGALMRKPMPEVPEVKFVGDILSTSLWLYVDPAGKDWHSWSFKNSRGDGTVPAWSANNDFETLAGSEPSFAEHSTIFEDKGLASKLARELLNDQAPPVKAQIAEEIPTADGVKRLDLLTSTLDPLLVSPGDTTNLKLKLEFADDVMPGIVEPSVLLHGQDAAKLKMIETTMPADITARQLTFDAEIHAPADEGTYRIDIDIPGKGPIATYLSVYK